MRGVAKDGCNPGRLDLRLSEGERALIVREPPREFLCTGAISKLGGHDADETEIVIPLCRVIPDKGLAESYGLSQAAKARCGPCLHPASGGFIRRRGSVGTVEPLVRCARVSVRSELISYLEGEGADFRRLSITHGRNGIPQLLELRGVVFSCVGACLRHVRINSPRKPAPRLPTCPRLLPVLSLGMQCARQHIPVGLPAPHRSDVGGQSSKSTLGRERLPTFEGHDGEIVRGLRGGSQLGGTADCLKRVDIVSRELGAFVVKPVAIRSRSARSRRNGDNAEYRVRLDFVVGQAEGG